MPSRYGIARSALYTRLKDLKIEPGKDGKRAYVDAAQIQLLDALHEHIQKGGTTGEFLKQLKSGSPGQSSTDLGRDEDSLGQSLALVSAGQSWTNLVSSASRLNYRSRSHCQALASWRGEA